MFGLPRFGEDKIRELLFRFGPRKRRRMADERLPLEWRKEGEARGAKADEEPGGERK